MKNSHDRVDYYYLRQINTLEQLSDYPNCPVLANICLGPTQSSDDIIRAVREASPILDDIPDVDIRAEGRHFIILLLNVASGEIIGALTLDLDTPNPSYTDEMEDPVVALDMRNAYGEVPHGIDVYVDYDRYGYCAGLCLPFPDKLMEAGQTCLGYPASIQAEGLADEASAIRAALEILFTLRGLDVPARLRLGEYY